MIDKGSVISAWLETTDYDSLFNFLDDNNLSIINSKIYDKNNNKIIELRELPGIVEREENDIEDRYLSYLSGTGALRKIRKETESDEEFIKLLVKKGYKISNGGTLILDKDNIAVSGYYEFSNGNLSYPGGQYGLYKELKEQSSLKGIIPEGSEKNPYQIAKCIVDKGYAVKDTGEVMKDGECVDNLFRIYNNDFFERIYGYYFLHLHKKNEDKLEDKVNLVNSIINNTINNPSQSWDDFGRNLILNGFTIAPKTEWIVDKEMNPIYNLDNLFSDGKDREEFIKDFNHNITTELNSESDIFSDFLWEREKEGDPSLSEFFEYLDKNNYRPNTEKVVNKDNLFSTKNWPDNIKGSVLLSLVIKEYEKRRKTGVMKNVDEKEKEEISVKRRRKFIEI